MIRWVFRPFTQLWASICTSERPSDLHLIFIRLHPRHVKIIIFRVVSELISLRSFKKIRTGRMCQNPNYRLLPSHSLSLRTYCLVFSPLYFQLWCTPWSVFQDGIFDVWVRHSEQAPCACQMQKQRKTEWYWKTPASTGHLSTSFDIVPKRHTRTRFQSP